MSGVNIFPFILIFFATIIGAIGSLFLKKGAAKFNRHFVKQIKNYQLLLGVFLYFLSSIFFIWSLKYGNVSVLYPITSLSYIWISFLSIRFLGEKMNKWKWTGIGLIVLGVILMTVV